MAADDELSVVVKPAGSKGKGAFAAESCAEGTFVCEYVGEPVTVLDTTQRYLGADPEYLFELKPDLSLDAQDSTHYSRFINHDEHGSLRVSVDATAQRVRFFAARLLEVGDELTFDYGPGYWKQRNQQPVTGTDSRAEEGCAPEESSVAEEESVDEEAWAAALPAPLCAHHGELMGKWVRNCPSFATREHNAASLVVLLLWCFPDEFAGVHSPISTERWEELNAHLRSHAEEGAAAHVVSELRSHADEAQIEELLASLQAVDGLCDSWRVAAATPDSGEKSDDE